jgi:FkbM family methyltransferase
MITVKPLAEQENSMQAKQLETANARATAKASEFMRTLPQGERGKLFNKLFHQNKNQNPYFGFVEAAIEDSRFLMFSGNDDLVAMCFFWYGPNSYEHKSMQIWQDRARSAKTILDVGAFSGVYTLAAATQNPDCRIHAIEAARRTYGRLLLNMQANGLAGRVNCVNKAVSNGPGREIFHRFKGENILGIGDGFMPKHLEPVASEEHVETIGLDQFCQENDIVPDLIKIDVEGAEILALDGMAGLLAGPKPDLLIEVTSDTCPTVFDRLRENGYAVSEINDLSGTMTPCTGKVSNVVNLFASAR